MIVFWILAALMAAAAAVLVMARAARAARVTGPDPTLASYQRALAEIDDLTKRNLIASEERRAQRAEAARRLLSAADRTVPALRRSPPILVAAVAVATALVALALYLAIGSPGSPDQPFAGRLANWRANPERYAAPQLAAVLNALAVERPRDPEPLRRLAALDISLGDPDGAIHALRRALRIAPDRPELIGPLAEIMVLKSGGKVEPDAQALLHRLLAVEPASPVARYYLARAQIETGDVAGGLAQWRSLLVDLRPDDTRRAQLQSEIATVERLGSLPTAAAGQSAPRAESVGAAIRGMVEGLAARLAAQPNDPDGWVRLVRAYTVLGDEARRDAALARARRLFANRANVLTRLNAASSPPT